MCGRPTAAGEVSRRAFADERVGFVTMFSAHVPVPPERAEKHLYVTIREQAARAPAGSSVVAHSRTRRLEVRLYRNAYVRAG